MAAGLGFKTFAVGEVLSAANVNGYLMQGVLVFANATARDAAITSPQEGQFAFTKDNDSLWYYSGSAWVSSGATGDIEGVTAGVGISGGGTSGTVTVTNSMATAIDAKGDLVVGTGADTFSRLAVGTNNYVLTADSAETTGLKWAAASGGSTFVGCQLQKITSTQSLTNNTVTAVTFNSELFDTDAFHDNSTNNSRITIPSGKAGKYLLVSAISFAGNATGTRIARIHKNGSLFTIPSILSAAPVADYTILSTTTLVDAQVGDYFEVFALQSSGGALNLNENGDGAGCTFGATFVGA
jgi:hypothetical protein